MPRIAGYFPDMDVWVPLQVDATGKVVISGDLELGDITVGDVGQGSAGVDPWLVTIADGDDATLGTTTDAAVTGDNAGTVSGKLRGINKVLFDVWDSVNHLFAVRVENTTLAVTQSGNWDIRNITGTIVLPTGAATSANQTTIIGHVDGIETLLTTIDGRVDGIEALLTAIDGHVDGIEGLLGGALTVNSHAVTNAGTFVVQIDGNALTSLQLIDDGVYTDDTSTHSTGSSKGYGIMAVATPTDGSVDANDIGMLAMTTDRKLKVEASGTVTTNPAAAATGGATTMNATSGDGSTALTNAAQVIKATAGTLYSVFVYNPNSVVAYVEFYNVAAASVTVGTTNPLFLLVVPPLSAIAPVMGGAAGVNFSNAGWSWAATTTASGNTALGTAVDAVAFYA